MKSLGMGEAEGIEGVGRGGNTGQQEEEKRVGGVHS